MVHMVRHSLTVVPDKDRKEVCSDLKKICRAGSEEAARQALEEFALSWDGKYPSISRKWCHHWENLITIFKYPQDIRRVIYTTNAIESLNMVIRKGIKNRRILVCYLYVYLRRIGNPRPGAEYGEHLSCRCLRPDRWFYRRNRSVNHLRHPRLLRDGHSDNHGE